MQSLAAELGEPLRPAFPPGVTQRDPSIDATNWRAEQAIRPAVVTRKVCGGNRSWAGAESQQILASVIRTSTQRDLNPHTVLASLAHARRPQIAAALN